MTASLEVYQTTGPVGLKTAAEAHHIIILVDVLRASSTVITALANGAQCIIPVATLEAARQRIGELPTAFLAGERRAHPPPDFDFGNSPRSFQTPRIRGHPIILTTSNFTRTLGTPPPEATILVGAFVNIEHVAMVARQLAETQHHPITLVAAGSRRGPAFEDDYTAEHIAIRIQAPNDPPSYASAVDIAHELMVTRHGSLLVQEGYEEDIMFCAQPNRYDLTPILQKGAFIPYIP